MDGSYTSESVPGFESGVNCEKDHQESDGNLNDDHLNLEGAVGGAEVMEHQDSECDGQRGTLSMDDDGGSFFESNTETVVRKTGDTANVQRDTANPTMTTFQQFLSNENEDGVLFDPAQRLNFDDTTEDEEGGEIGDDDKDLFNECVEQEDDMITGRMMDESFGESEGKRDDGDSNESDDGSSGADYLDQRPRVNGSDFVEDGAVAAAVASASSLASSSMNSVPDQGQNIRIIEGHDSSLQDDDIDGNPSSSNALRFNTNFMQTQMVNLPSLPNLPSGRSYGDSEDDEEDEDGQNLYDSLDPEDGTSPYGGHTVVEPQNLDPNTSEYYSAGSLLSLQTLTSQQSHHDGDGESLWPQQEVGEFSHFKGSGSSTNLANFNSFQQESFSSSSTHQDLSSASNLAGNSNFQSNGAVVKGISHEDQNSIVESSVGSGGDGASASVGAQSSHGSSVLTAPQHQELSNSQGGFELCEEGLLQGTQMYAQPLSSPSLNPNPNPNFDRESDDAYAGSPPHKIDNHVNYSFQQSDNNLQNVGEGGKAANDGGGNMSMGNMNSAPDFNQLNYLVSVDSNMNRDADKTDNNGDGSGNENPVRDGRQAATGSSGNPWSNQNQSAKPKVAKPTSVPRKRVTATAKVQQNKRPAVQGSASREASNRGMGIAGVASLTGVGSSSNDALASNSVTSTSASATNKKTTKNSSSLAMSSTASNSVRASVQGGDSAATSTSVFASTDKRDQVQSVGDNCAVSDGGSRPGLGGHTEANRSGKNSKFSRTYQPQTSSRATSSYASMSSLTSASNSRVSGVGKESHHSKPRAPGQISSGHSLRQSSFPDQGSLHGGHNADKQQDKAARVVGAPSASSHSVSSLENQVKGINARQSQMPHASSSLDLPTSVNTCSQSSSSHHVTSSSLFNPQSQHQHQQLLHQQKLPQHHLRQQQQPPHMQQHHYHQDYIKRQQHQVPIQHSSSSNPFQLSPQNPPSPSGSDHSSHHSYNREQVFTQMDSLQQRQSAIRPSQLPQHMSAIGQSENGIPGMEEVRSHLHSMLNMAADRSISGLDQSETATELLSFDQPVQRQLQFDVDTSTTFNGTNGPEDMSEILENFPTFSSKMFSEMSGVSINSASGKHDSLSQGENQYLRESLEKERYRRKHCEQQIQRLNAKLLETQQQLAVAVSTDKRKDLMIEQLDKQLARVVEGWKKREADKDNLLTSLTEEKEQVEESLLRHQTMISNFERDLALTVAELKEEKEKSSETIGNLRSELTESRQMREEMEEDLASAADKCNKMAAEWDTLTKAKVNAETLAQKTQDSLVEEENKWKLKESDLINKIGQVKEANQKVINMEKVKLEEEKKKRENLESECEDLKSELRKLVLDTEQLVREKESQKVEMSIMEAKFESAQRKLEADLHAQMEKEIAEQAKDYHSKLETAMEEMSEKHRKQVADLHTRHQRDLERQMAVANDEMDKKDNDFKNKLVDMEEMLSESRNEISNLKQAKLKLESQRMEILSKLQFMMQSQWNEAVSLLVSTPQKKGLSSSFMSNQSMSLSGFLANSQSSQQPTIDNSSAASTINNSGSSGNNDSSLTASLNLASLIMSTSTAPPPPPPSSSSSTSLFQQSTVVVTAPTTATMTSSTTTATTVSTPPQGKQKTGYGETTGQMKMSEKNASPFCIDGVESGGGGGGGGFGYDGYVSGGSSNNNSVLSASHNSSGPNQISNSIYSAKDRENQGGGGGGKGEEMAKMDRVEEYMFRSAIQGSNPLSSNHHDHKPTTYPVSSQSQPPVTVAAISSPGSVNPIMSAIVHHPSVQTQGYKAVAIKSPRQTSSSLYWNDVGVDVSGVPLEQGSHAPPPSAVNSYTSMTQDDLSPATASSVVNSHCQMSQRQQQQQQQHLHHHPHQISHHQTQQQQSHHEQLQLRQRQQQQKQQQQQRHQKEASTSEQVWPPSFYHGNSLQRDHAMNGGDLSPPVRQPALRREDLEDSVTSQGSSVVTDPVRLQADYSHLTDQVDAHMNRQEELQHYIQMLLQKAPGTVEWEGDKGDNDSFDFLESSRDLTVDLDLTETSQALEVTRQMTRLHELRERQQGKARRQGDGLAGQSRGTSNQSQATNKSVNTSCMSDMGMGLGETQVLTPQNLVEISQLLSLYRDQWESSPETATKANTAGQLMDALRKSQGVEANLNGLSSDKITAVNPGSVAKNSPRGQHNNKKSKTSSLSSSTSSSSAATKDNLTKNKRKAGYQNSEHTGMNTSTDSMGHHHVSSGHGTVSSKPGAFSSSSSSTAGGRRGHQGGGGGGKGGGPSQSTRSVKTNGSGVWK